MAFLDYLTSLYPPDGSVTNDGKIIKHVPVPMPIDPSVAHVVSSDATQPSSTQLAPTLQQQNVPSPVTPAGVTNPPRQTGANIPGPGPVESQLGQIAKPINRADYKPSTLQTILNVIGGAAGGAGGHPDFGRQLRDRKYNQAVEEQKNKIDALGEPTKLEQGRQGLGVREQTEAERISHDVAGEANAKNLADLKAKSESDKLANEKTVNDLKAQIADNAVKYHQGELDQKSRDENDKLLLAKINNLEKQAEEQGRNTRNDKTIAGRTTDAKILAGSRADLRDTPPKPISDAASVILDSLKNKDGQPLKDTIDGIADNKVKDQVIAGLPSIGKTYQTGSKATGQEVNRAGQAVVTMSLVNKAKAIVDRIPDTTGPIKGRIQEGKLRFGTDEKNVIDIQQLASYLKLIPTSDAAAMGGGRATATLVNYLKSGSGSFSMPKDQLKSALDSIYSFAKLNARGQEATPETTTPVKGTKFEVIK